MRGKIQLLMSSYSIQMSGSTTFARPGTIGAGGGAFAYGTYGFLYKKKAGGGGRRSTLNIPGGGAMTNKATYLYNKYKPGETGIGAQTTANRRAKNIRASVCTPDNKCAPFYNTLGANPYRNLGRAMYPIFPGIPLPPSLPPTPAAAITPSVID
jgi:hypothetical protein